MRKHLADAEEQVAVSELSSWLAEKHELCVAAVYVGNRAGDDVSWKSLREVELMWMKLSDGLRMNNENLATLLKASQVEKKI